MQPDDFTKIESIFVRHRNCLLLRGQFTGIYTDHYLHLMENGIRYPAELDAMLKDALGPHPSHRPQRRPGQL
jgi:molecular chaperone Hsp33